VRAPWTAIAPLSLALWTLGAWWPPFAGHGRSRIVVAVLAASLLLALLRLVPKHEVPPPPGWQAPPEPERPARPGLAPPPLAGAPSLVVLGTALALLAPLPLWHHAPGPRLAFQTTTSRLLVWRDGIPASYEPLLPLEPVGAHAPALATLAADVSLLTGVDSGKALVAVVTATAGLLLVGLFALHAIWTPPPAAALGSLVALAVSPWPSFLSAWGEGEALLALGFLLPAAALLLGHASRSRPCRGHAARRRPRAAALAARASRWSAVSFGRRGPSPRRGRSPRASSRSCSRTGLRPSRGRVGARGAGDAPPAGRTSSLPFAFGCCWWPSRPLAFVQAAGHRTSAARAAVAGASMLAALLLVVRVHGWFASGQLSEGTRAALARAARVTTPLESICAGEGERDFVPALAGRRAGEPGVWIPRVYADEWARRERRPCRVRLEDLRARP
jgi:hypothetical protein